jgi:hypothetical protein
VIATASRRRVVVSNSRQRSPIAAGPRPEASRPARAPKAPTTRPPRASAELGAVAGAVVGGERAAAQRVGDALVDQRAQQDVLDAVRDAAEGEPDHRRPQEGGRGGAHDPEALDDDREQRGDSQLR